MNRQKVSMKEEMQTAMKEDMQTNKKSMLIDKKDPSVSM